MTEVEAFNATSDWSSQSGSTSPTKEGTGFGEFYYGSTHFNASALSLVVCCAMYGVYTATDTAHVLSQQQQHNPSLERILTADDVIGVVRKAVLENSTAYQALKAAGQKSSLVREILAPMVDANCVRMRSFFSVHGYEIKPTWYPRVLGPRPLRLPLSVRRETPSETVKDGKNEDSNRKELEGLL